MAHAATSSFFLLAGALLASPVSAVQTSPEPTDLGYWNGNDWQALTTAPDALGIVFAPELTEGAIRARLANYPGLAADQATKALVWPGHTVVVQLVADLSSDEAWALAEQISVDTWVHEAAPRLIANETGETLFLTDEILVRWRDGVSTSQREAWTQGLKRTGTLDYTMNPGNVFAVDSSEDLLTRVNELASSGLVEFAHPDFRVERISYSTSNDPFYPNQWHLESTGLNGAGVDEDIDAEGAWAITRGTASVTIAVVDTGTELQHPDLVDNLVQGVDVLSNDNDPQAEDGTWLGIFRWQESHGTSVSGVSAGRGDNGIGISGVAPRCTVMPIRFLSELFGPTPTVQDEADAFNFACQNGAAILNNSWGPAGSATLPASTRAAIDNCNQFGRNGLGSVIFFAAGNSGANNSGNGYATYPGVLGVTAVNDQGVLSSYSSFGSTVDLCAPSNGGVNGIVTTDRLGTKGYSNTDYTDSFGGTSSASPTAAGVMGLIMSADPSLTREDAIDILLETAEKVDTAGGSYNSNGFSNFYGYGRANAADAANEAVTRMNGLPSNTIYLNGTTFATAGSTAQFQFSGAPAQASWAAVASFAGGSSAVLGNHFFDVSARYVQLKAGVTTVNGTGNFSGTVPANLGALGALIEVVVPTGGDYTDSNGLLLRLQ
ncbi:MAG: S8 family serine peptidase [Planctomycetes bacterium]|nr:S8 family serine peptidase [Planctomycetota bacterium]